MNNDLVCNKEEIKCNKIIKQYKKFNFDYITEEEMKEHNPNWEEISDHSCRILIIRGPEFAKQMDCLI